eukprot:g35352.t1
MSHFLAQSLEDKARCSLRRQQGQMASYCTAEASCDVSSHCTAAARQGCTGKPMSHLIAQPLEDKVMSSASVCLI